MGGTIDPRFRERWIDVRRQEGQRRLRAVIAVVIVTAVAGGGVGATFSPLLAVEHLRADGTAHLPTSRIVAVSGLDDHRPMVSVATSAVAGRLQAEPWVASARVIREWPTTIRIVVGERRAVVVVASADPATSRATVEVDATGRVLTAPTPTGAALPRLMGSPAPGRAGSWLAGTSATSRPSGLLGEALAAAAAMPASVSGRIGGIVVDPAGAVTLALSPGPAVVKLGRPPAASLSPPETQAAPALTGSDVALVRQMEALATLVANVDLSKVAQIDLTVPDRPALTPAPGAAILSTK